MRSRIVQACAALRRVLGRREAPLVILAVVSVLSLGARTWELDEPCARVCSSDRDRTLIFDETYYVNAARIIDGFPASAHYVLAPIGRDPNAEHPQLGKLLIAGSIKVFGDRPLGWRFPALIFGSLLILAMYALARAARAAPWLATGIASLTAAENLLMVHGRIGTLDIMVVTVMVAAATLYLRGRRTAAGALLGVGACIKLVAPYLLLVFLLVELLRMVQARQAETGSSMGVRRRAAGLLLCGGASALVYAGGLAVMDRLVPAYDTANGITYSTPLEHTRHMLKFAADLSAPDGAKGIASYPWQWIGDFRPIVYVNVDTSRIEDGHTVLESTTHFLGVVNPPILAVAVPAFLLALWRVRRRAEDADIIGIAWCVGTFVPFALASALLHRISYLYYMVIVLPGILLLAGRLFARPWMPRWVRVLWALGIIVAGVVMYPFVVVADPNWVS